MDKNTPVTAEQLFQLFSRASLERDLLRDENARLTAENQRLRQVLAVQQNKPETEKRET